MQGNPAHSGLAREIRMKAQELAQLAGAAKGYWTLELRIEDGLFKNIRLHHGPLHSNEDLERLARSVGVLRD
jgi:hypothetical protein